MNQKKNKLIFVNLSIQKYLSFALNDRNDFYKNKIALYKTIFWSGSQNSTHIIFILPC